MKSNNFRKNGKKGGRPKGSSYKTVFIIPEYSSVILTKQQYSKLLERFGAEVLKIALSIFENWLNNSPVGYKYKGKNNYAHFRADGWLINEAKLTTQQI